MSESRNFSYTKKGVFGRTLNVNVCSILKNGLYFQHLFIYYLVAIIFKMMKTIS